MFNGDLKEKALNRLKNSNNKYQKTAKVATLKATELHHLRIKCTEEVITDAENYINTLANSPKEFDKSIEDLNLSYSSFNHILKSIDTSSGNAIGGSTAGAGVATGVGVAAFGPSAAMAVATTFGTASTGTAISALSGAAATNAALAWLGGGAIVAGGGGMAGGGTLLALAGPIGWGIGAAGVIGGGLWARSKNKDTAEKANKEARKIEAKNASLNAAIVEIRKLNEQTVQHTKGACNQLMNLSATAPKNFQQFNIMQKKEIGALVNNIESLAMLLKQNVK